MFSNAKSEVFLPPVGADDPEDEDDEDFEEESNPALDDQTPEELEALRQMLKEAECKKRVMPDIVQDPKTGKKCNDEELMVFDGGSDSKRQKVTEGASEGSPVDLTV